MSPPTTGGSTVNMISVPSLGQCRKPPCPGVSLGHASAAWQVQAQPWPAHSEVTEQNTFKQSRDQISLCRTADVQDVVPGKRRWEIRREPGSQRVVKNEERQRHMGELGKEGVQGVSHGRSTICGFSV